MDDNLPRPSIGERIRDVVGRVGRSADWLKKIETDGCANLD